MHRKILTICGCAAFLGAGLPQLASADADTDNEALAEITITAEKTTESLQKTAAAVTAVPAVELQDMGVTNLREAQKLVPSVRFQAEGNNTQVFIRGVGANLDQANVEPNVAFNFAGIYMPREATSAGFFDVQQFETLPGPQGTLYGRSAIGGTINVSPTRPGFDNDGNALLELGNYATVHGSVGQNVRLTDTLAVRAAVDYIHSQGVETTGADSKNDPSARLSALFNPLDKLTIYAWTQYASKNGYAANLVNKGLDPVTGAYCEQCFLSSNPWNDKRDGQFAGPFGPTVAEENHYRTWMVGGQVDYNFDWATLSYLPSYLYLDARPHYWLSAIRSSNTAHYNQITQELRLSSNGSGPFKWLGGLYFYNIRNDGQLILYLPDPLLQDNVEADRLKGFAVFGQTTYSITDTLRATVGARASTTSRTAHGHEPVALGGQPYTFDKSFDNIDWKVGAEKDLSSSAMVYGALQTGYQPGTFNELPNTDTYSNEVKPSRLMAYTLGAKSRWLDDSLQINDELYWYDYRDLLIQSYNIAAAYNTIFNARKVVIKGNQLDILAKVFRTDQLNFNLGYTQARNKDFTTPGGANYDGLQLVYSPDWQALAGYTHNMQLGEATLRAHLDWRFESSWYADYPHNRGTRQGPSNKGDASITYDMTRWSVGAWIKNIQGKAVIAATAAAGIPGPGTAYLDQPRTYGLRFTMNY